MLLFIISTVDINYAQHMKFNGISMGETPTVFISIIAKTKCAKIENETSKTSLFFASFFLLASGFVKCKLNAD